VDFDVLAVCEKEDGAARLLPGDFEECRDTDSAEAVRAPRRRDAQLAGTTDPRLSVDLNQELPSSDAQNLIGVVVTMQVAYFARCHRLHLHD
jgi:hypothetical protein